MKKTYILILIVLSMFLIACTDPEQAGTSDAGLDPTLQMMESSMEDDEVVVRIFAPGYESFEDMVEDSDLIIRGRVLNERVENVNVHITLEQAIAARMREYEEGLISREERDLSIEDHHENVADFAPHYEDVIFYRVEILEIFQGNYEVGDIVELAKLMVWDEDGNPSLEHSNRYEVDAELVLFLRSSRSLGYFTLHPHQTVYEVPADLDTEEDVEVILDYVEEFQREVEDGIYITNGITEPFEINLRVLRELAKENGLLRQDNPDLASKSVDD